MTMSECGRGLLQVSGERTHEFGRRMGMDGLGNARKLQGGPSWNSDHEVKVRPLRIIVFLQTYSATEE